MLKETGQEQIIDTILARTFEFQKIYNKAECELLNIEIGRWKLELTRQTKLRFNRLYKDNYETETFVKKMLYKIK